MFAFNVNAPIALAWRPEFEPLLNELTKLLNRTGRFRKSSHAVTLTLLNMLNSGRRPTPSQVVDAIYHTYDQPVPGKPFSTEKWLSYIPLVVTALRSPDPRSVLTI